MTKYELVKKYQEKLELEINPDKLRWVDLGFNEKPSEYGTIEEYLKSIGYCSEGQVVSIDIYREVINDIEDLECCQ